MKYQILSSLSVLLVSVTPAPVFASSTSPTVGNTTVDVLLKQQEQLGWTEHDSTSFTPNPVRKGVREQLVPQTDKTGTTATTNSAVTSTPTAERVNKR